MSITFRVTESLGAPPERVWAALTDLGAAARWLPGLVRIEPLDAAPLRVGSRWRATRQLAGEEGSERVEVTELTPPSRLALRLDGTQGTSSVGERRLTYNLAPEGEGTRVTLDGEIRGLHGVEALRARLAVGSHRKAGLKDLRALDAYLAAVPAPAPSMPARETVGTRADAAPGAPLPPHAG